MSSLRNSLHRRNHKERSQLSHRTRLGILEKHKDYVKRAKDFHSKQERIKRLKEKAAERNKDEFYFGMTKSHTKEGVHIRDRGNSALPIDFVKILKTQDQNYIRAVRQASLKKIDKLKAELLSSRGQHEDDVSLDEEESEYLREAGILPPLEGSNKHKPKHVIFVFNTAEVAEYEAPTSADASSKTTTDLKKGQKEGIDLGWGRSDKKITQNNTSSSRVEMEESDDSMSDIGATGETKDDEQRRLLKELAARLKRERNLLYAGRELELQRLLMGKGASRKIRGAVSMEGNDEKEDEDEIDARRGKSRKSEVRMEPKAYQPRVYKWKGERKK